MNPEAQHGGDSWDPEETSPHATLFGLPPAPEQARIHVLPVPWDATCSYGRGTAQGPLAIQQASLQLDLMDPVFGEVWRQGIHLHTAGSELTGWADEARHAVDRLQQKDLEAGDRTALIEEIDRLSDLRSRHVETWTRRCFADGHIPAILGGDHSSPLGAIRAAASLGDLSILHLDAHLDQRAAYDGLRESHASIFYNVLEQCSQVTRLLSLGVRDYSAGEWERVKQQPDRVQAIPLPQWQEKLLGGRHFSALCDRALSFLGERVWISFDIDVLSPELCPRTGTPVPGGLGFAEATHILHAIAATGRQIVGFDLCEVWGPGPEARAATGPEDLAQLEWDANVGARILYKLCGCAHRTVRSFKGRAGEG